MAGKHQKDYLSVANVHRKERWGATKIIRNVSEVEEKANMLSAVKSTSQKGVQNCIGFSCIFVNFLKQKLLFSL